jgi:hypothetical protein
MQRVGLFALAAALVTAPLGEGKYLPAVALDFDYWGIVLR